MSKLDQKLITQSIDKTIYTNVFHDPQPHTTNAIYGFEIKTELEKENLDKLLKEQEKKKNAAIYKSQHFSEDSKCKVNIYWANSTEQVEEFSRRKQYVIAEPTQFELEHNFGEKTLRFNNREDDYLYCLIPSSATKRFKRIEK